MLLSEYVESLTCFNRWDIFLCVCITLCIIECQCQTLASGLSLKKLLVNRVLPSPTPPLSFLSFYHLIPLTFWIFHLLPSVVLWTIFFFLHFQRFFNKIFLSSSFQFHLFFLEVWLVSPVDITVTEQNHLNRGSEAYPCRAIRYISLGSD